MSKKTTTQRPANYFSPAIRERRQRILDEARIMISEHGINNFSMDELCVRADVAKRTLYNAFQSKELIIATAIQQYFDTFVEKIPYATPAGSLQRIIERLAWIVRRNMEIRNYIRVLMAIYFSPDVDPDIWKSVHMLGVRFNMEWIGKLESKRQLQPWVNPEQLAHDIIRFEYVLINDWCQGRIDDDSFLSHILLCYLTLVVGATKGKARRELEEMLMQLKDGKLLKNYKVSPSKRAEAV
jgi:TetR/AcrR family transcriptional regulator, cholesterol catabolism regulator